MPDLSDGIFLRFVAYPPLPGHSTMMVDVIQKSTGHREATIKWKGRRGYSLWPEPGAVFGPKCLKDITRVITSLNESHSAKEN